MVNDLVHNIVYDMIHNTGLWVNTLVWLFTSRKWPYYQPLTANWPSKQPLAHRPLPATPTRNSHLGRARAPETKVVGVVGVEARDWVVVGHGLNRAATAVYSYGSQPTIQQKRLWISVGCSLGVVWPTNIWFNDEGWLIMAKWCFMIFNDGCCMMNSDW